MKDHVWINGVTFERGVWQLLVVRRQGDRFVQEPVPLSDALDAPALDLASSPYRWARNNVVPVTCPDLRKLEQLYDPGYAVRSAVTGFAVSKAHTVFVLRGESPVFLPAWLLIQSLFLGARRLNDALMTPQGIDLLGTHIAGAYPLTVRVHWPMTSMDLSGRTARLLAWVLSRVDARISHASILAAARSNRLTLTLPQAALSCWVSGIQTDKGLLAYSLGGVDLRFPLDSKKVVVEHGDKTRIFPAYEPPSRCPWGNRQKSAEQTAIFEGEKW